MTRAYAGVFAAVGWFSVVGQYVNTYAGSLAGTINYFSYFTILSNILVAATLTSAALALARESGIGRLLNKPAVATATALYITVTGLIYFFILSHLYQLEGWTLQFDRLLHYVMPPAYVVFWLAFVPKGTLDLRNVVWMLVVPLVYGAYTLARGPVAGWYPYPFIDAATLGYPRTFRNTGEFIIFFAFMGSIYVLIDRLIGRLRR